MARITVVVPIYDVEDYLEECLSSVAAQTVEDLDVVMVDDGSTDASATIAQRFARQDGRFRLLQQPNGGLGRARNVGLEAAGGDYLAFLDSDDVLPPDAYELLLRPLESTGSDFATGNVQRISRGGLEQAGFVAKAFARTRLKTHVRRFEPLISDRTAWNKLWRRSFWDGCGLRFPEGRLHEDIPVVVPAHFRATSVDVVAAPVYRWRLREGGGPSITQRRRELRVLQDRFRAVEQVWTYLERHESATQRRRYARSVVAADLLYHLDELCEVDDEYRAVFMRRANAFLDGVDRRSFDRLPAIDRVKWHLVRHDRLPELLELLRFQREDALSTPPARRHGRHYAAYPGCADPALAIPRSALRLGRRDKELHISAHLEDVRFEQGKLRLSGHAYINALGAPSPASQRLTLGAVPAGRAHREHQIRMRVAAHPIPTAPARRADLDPALSWAGFHASLDLGQLRRGTAPADGTWELFAAIRRSGLHRFRTRFAIEDPQLVGTLEDVTPDGVLTTACVTHDGKATVRVATRWLRIERCRSAAGALRITGRSELEEGAGVSLEAARTGDRLALRFPVALEHGTFQVDVPLHDLRAEPPATGRPRDRDAAWDLRIATASGPAPPLVLAGAVTGGAWRSPDGLLVSLARTAAGGVQLLERESAPVPALEAPARGEAGERPALPRIAGDTAAVA
jgi:CDP-glycerol glycerophosphotransferase